MSETPPEVAYPWLPPARLQGWVKVDAEADNAENVEYARLAAADWVQDQRPDLFVTEVVDDVEVRVFEPTERVIQAAVIAAARILSRAGNLAGLVNYGEFAGAVLRSDPDVAMLLGRPKRTVVG